MMKLSQKRADRPDRLLTDPPILDLNLTESDTPCPVWPYSMVLSYPIPMGMGIMP